MFDFELVELWAKAENKLKDKHLIVVCNTKANPGPVKIYAQNCLQAPAE